MAADLEKKLLRGEVMENNSLEEETGLELWSSILSEVSTRSSSKLPSGKNILVLGDDGSGKSSLMAKLRGVELNKTGRGLEYLYLTVHDDERDDLACCNVWILDEDVFYQQMLKFAVQKDTLEDTLALLIVDMSRPWTISQSLSRWSRVLTEHVQNLNISPEHLRDLQERVVRGYQQYTEPGGLVPGCAQRDEVLLPLGETVLTHNLGIPLIIICTKCDTVSGLERQLDYRDQHFDFIQSHLRRFCLHYGAALIYTSVKQEVNVELLYKYLLHKLYNFPFTSPAPLLERETLFIPAGWDSEVKIRILEENLTLREEDLFENFITKPPVRKLVDDKEIYAEDEQVFLMKQQSLLAKQPATPTRATESPGRTASGSPRPIGRTGPTNVASVSPTVKKPDPNLKGAVANEGVLANFFNSLLSKKSGAPPTSGASGATTQGPNNNTGQKPALIDVQAELNRMTVDAHNQQADTHNQA